MGRILRRLSVLAAAALVLGASAASGSSASPTRHVVSIRDIAYHPGRLVIDRGDRVSWRFLDPEVSHNVRSRGRLRFRSISTRQTGTVTRTFNHAGTYRFICTIHLGMAGKVVVQ